MKILVTLKHSQSGELKPVKVGWSWTLFLFSSILGIPLFMRKLYGIGAVFLTFFVVNLILSSGANIAATLDLPDETLGYLVILQITSQFLGLALAIWIGIKGNELTAKNNLEKGWVFAEPESDATKFARGKWGLSGV